MEIAARSIQAIVRAHLEKALDTDDPHEKNYHIRSALQGIIIDEDILFRNSSETVASSDYTARIKNDLQKALRVQKVADKNYSIRTAYQWYVLDHYE